MQEKPVDYIYCTYDAGGNFNSRNNFANLGSFAKVFSLVQSIVFLCIPSDSEINQQKALRACRTLIASRDNNVHLFHDLLFDKVS